MSDQLKPCPCGQTPNYLGIEAIIELSSHFDGVCWSIDGIVKDPDMAGFNQQETGYPLFQVEHVKKEGFIGVSLLPTGRNDGEYLKVLTVTRGVPAHESLREHMELLSEAQKENAALKEECRDLQQRLDRWNHGHNAIGTNHLVKRLKKLEQAIEERDALKARVEELEGVNSTNQALIDQGLSDLQAMSNMNDCPFVDEMIMNHAGNMWLVLNQLKALKDKEAG